MVVLLIGTGLLNAGVFQMWMCRLANTVHRALPVFEWPALDMPPHGQMQPLQCAAGVVEPVLGAVAGLGRWFVGGAVFLHAGAFFQVWMRRLTTTARGALPVVEWPALGMPRATARSNTASAVCSSYGGA